MSELGRKERELAPHSTSKRPGTRPAQGHASRGTCAAQPNGVALSPDGRTLYVTDTAKVHKGAPQSAARTIYRYDVTRNGPGRRRQLANRRVFAMAPVGAPDGIKARSRSCLVLDRRRRVCLVLWLRSVVDHPSDACQVDVDGNVCVRCFWCCGCAALLMIPLTPSRWMLMAMCGRAWATACTFMLKMASCWAR